MPEPFVVAFVVGVTPGKWARAWEERMPRHPLTLQQLAQPAALAALADGTADVALLRLPVADDALSVIPLYTERPVAVAAKGHAIEAADEVSLADLAEFMILDDSDWAAAVELAAANVGIAIMPQSVARAHSRRDVTARLVTDAADTRIALAWPTEHTTPAVEQFVGIVRGRTANSSRGAVADEPKPASKPAKVVKPGRKPKAGATPKLKGKRR
ncbi:MAG: LysR family transcriptional regulator substrate-binding protein [Rhodoglobus sp.]